MPVSLIVGSQVPKLMVPAMIRAMPIEWPTDLATNWFDYRRRSRGTRTERKALELGEPAYVISADDWVFEMMSLGGPEAVAVLAHLAEAAPDDDGLLMVGVGPVEDLLSDHGEGIVGLFLDEARRVPALARALTYAEISDGSLSASSIEQLNQLRR